MFEHRFTVHRLRRFEDAELRPALEQPKGRKQSVNAPEMAALPVLG